MAGQHRGQAHLRRLFRAPDSASQIIATCDKAYVPYLTYTASMHTAAVAPHDEDAKAPRVSLPFPAIDLAWCPFKKGESESCFLTTCRDQPLQLWDVEDATLRASYVATNDSDYHTHAHAVCWFGSGSGAHPHWIAGGYGGFEDAAQVRIFDVVAEGNQPVWTYGARHDHGLVSTLLDCAWTGTTSLLAVGYYNVPAVHMVDCRHRCPVAELHGLKQGVRTLRVCADDPLHVYAGGSQGDSRIACWDLRQPRQPLFTLLRCVHTDQVFEFDLLPFSLSPSIGCRRLVTSSSAGGVLVHTWKAGEIPSSSSDKGVVFGASVGPTSGLTVVGADTVVVSTGCREHRSVLRHGMHNSGDTANKRKQTMEAGEEGLDGVGDFPVFPRHKRARSPMSDDSDVESASPGAQAGKIESAALEAANVAVIVLK